MQQPKIFYQGNSSGVFSYETFQDFMKNKGLRIPYQDFAVYKKDIYIVEPSTTIIYEARKRIVPRNLDLWHVTITLWGHGREEVESKLLQALEEYSSV